MRSKRILTGDWDAEPLIALELWAMNDFEYNSRYLEQIITRFEWLFPLGYIPSDKNKMVELFKALEHYDDEYSDWSIIWTKVERDRQIVECCDERDDDE